MIQLTSCYFCLDSAALLKLHKQPFYAQTEGQSRTVILPPYAESFLVATFNRQLRFCRDKAKIPPLH